MSSSLVDVSFRPARPEDAEAVAQLIAAYDARFGGHVDATADDLYEEWRQIDLDRDSWLWELDGRPVAYATVYERHERLTVDGYVQPGHAGRGLGAAILAVTEARARERGFDALRNATLAADAAAVRLFESHGYRDVRHFYRMRIELHAPPDEPRWPDGLEPRPVSREHARAFHAASEDAFAREWGYVPDPFERFEARRLESPNLALELWTAVWDGDEVAATLIADRHRHGSGWIASVGVREPWRRRGVGLALIQRAFRQFWELGEPRVQLGVDAQNATGATRLYERAGMHVVWEAIVYEKELAP
jgi:mycothiol synthase